MRYDAIISLGGNINPDGTLSQLSKNRLEKAISLYKKKMAPRIILSGSHSFLSLYKPPQTEALIMQKEALKLGIPKKVLFLEQNSKDTIGNAYFTKLQLLEPNNWKKIIIVTSDFHLTRTRYVFKKILGEAYRTKFVGCRTRTTFMDRTSERILLHFSHRYLDPIPYGDDAYLRKWMFENHPGYAKKPKLLKLLKAINKIRKRYLSK